MENEFNPDVFCRVLGKILSDKYGEEIVVTYKDEKTEEKPA